MKESLKDKIFRRLGLKDLQSRHSELVRSADMVMDRVCAFLDVLQFLAALACIVCLALYVGFDKDVLDHSMIFKVIGSSQTIFIIAVFANLINPQRRKRRVLMRRVFDVVIILTLVPVVMQHCEATESAFFHFFHSRRFLFACLGIYSVAQLCYGSMNLLGRYTNPSLILSVSFILFILIGSFALMLPKCTVGSSHLRYIDALFMATSAVSMTGLSTVDTAGLFTPLGWTVMAVLMQIGALGVLTFTSFFAIFFSGNRSIYSQMLMRDFIFSKSMSALVPVILYILSFTLVIEFLGALAIYFTLPDGFESSFGNKAAFAAFHSLSAFCNCGFTTLPHGLATPELMNGTPLFYIVIVVLILAGGIGFPNLVNLRDVLVEYIRRIRAFVMGRSYVRKVHVYDLNTKLVLLFTLIFFVGGSVVFYLLEYNHALEGMPVGEKIMQAVFCSATVRTAGFVTVAPSHWLGVTFVIALFLMWVGCASQSMGGGIKINAFAAVLFNLRSIVMGQKGVAVFGRSISLSSVRRSNAVVCFSILAIFVYSCLLMILEPELPAASVAFEAFSALTTVGMSFGITPEFGDVAKIVLATAMFLGRVGVISVLCGIIGDRPDISVNLPADDIVIN